MLSNIKIVLIQTFHPGNIGAAARAMKNMGLANLVLVNPVDFPSEQAIARASRADDVLSNANVVGSLEDAIADCSLVVAASARDRSITLPVLSARAAGKKLALESLHTDVALVFGRERMGLHNTDIQQCHMQVNINANPDYPALNLAQAIQIMCYEIYQASSSLAASDAKIQAMQEKEDDAVYPLNKELESFYGYLEQVLDETDFFDANKPGQAMGRLRALYRRARPTKQELNLLRSSLKALAET